MGLVDKRKLLFECVRHAKHLCYVTWISVISTWVLRWHADFSVWNCHERFYCSGFYDDWQEMPCVRDRQTPSGISVLSATGISMANNVMWKKVQSIYILFFFKKNRRRLYTCSCLWAREHLCNRTSIGWLKANAMIRGWSIKSNAQQPGPRHIFPTLLEKSDKAMSILTWRSLFRTKITVKMLLSKQIDDIFL